MRFWHALWIVILHTVLQEQKARTVILVSYQQYVRGRRRSLSASPTRERARIRKSGRKADEAPVSTSTNAVESSATQETQETQETQKTSVSATQTQNQKKGVLPAMMFLRGDTTVLFLRMYFSLIKNIIVQVCVRVSERLSVR
jgi:hypothetical protein